MGPAPMVSSPSDLGGPGVQARLDLVPENCSIPGSRERCPVSCGRLRPSSRWETGHPTGPVGRMWAENRSREGHAAAFISGSLECPGPTEGVPGSGGGTPLAPQSLLHEDNLLVRRASLEGFPAPHLRGFCFLPLPRWGTSFPSRPVWQRPL